VKGIISTLYIFIKLLFFLRLNIKIRFATIPNVSWSDVGALTSIREELGLSILQPIKNPMRYRNMGLNPSAGVCLYPYISLIFFFLHHDE
jgi:hypothetical protein